MSRPQAYELSEPQADVVAYLGSLPSAHLVRVSADWTIGPNGRTRHTLKISGGGRMDRPCPCGRECGHRQNVNVHGRFVWRGTTFADAEVQGKRYESIVQAKRAMHKRLEVETDFETFSRSTPNQ